MKALAHQPVMLKEVLDYLAPNAGARYLDLTAGYGGHAAAVIEKIGSAGQATLVDRDQAAISSLKARFSDAKVIHSSYAKAVLDLAARGEIFDMVLMDLGLSSQQLLTPARGFSIKHEGPLDMRMDVRSKLTAGTVVNTYPEQKLASLIEAYGEDYQARKIAREIVKSRPIKTTNQLGQTIARAKQSYKKGFWRVHPATKTFQALRIEVNDELGQLRAALAGIAKILKIGGRLSVISFHSLEDREVKHFLKNHQGFEVLTKKPLSGKIYDPKNPRARSAKLRAAKKIKNKRINQNGNQYQSIGQ